MNIAAVALKQQRWETALVHSSTVLVALACPQNAKALYRKAVALRGLRRLDDAIAAAAEASCLTAGGDAAIERLAGESAARRPRAKTRGVQSVAPLPPSAAAMSAAGAPTAPPAVPAFTGKVVERAFLAPASGAAAGESSAPPKKISRFLAKRRGALDEDED